MNAEEYRRAGMLFDQIRCLPKADWQQALEQACPGNVELKYQVLQMLQADHDGGSFLERHAIHDAARLLTRPPADVPEPGTSVGNYRLETRIGAGGMGVVFEAEDLRLHRRVAVKVLPLAFAADGAERVKRFQREARAASSLNHPNIVSIFDADFAQGFYYIAMELVEGKTVRQLIAAESKGLDSQTLLNVVAQLASALSAAHQAGIVHRDIKPENIMLRLDGFVKVLDFGLAKLRERASNADDQMSELHTRPGNLAGTIQYLSPEQVAGKPALPQSDLFSVGVVAYEIATGVRPFDGPTDGAVFDAILNRTPLPPSSLRPSLGPELDRMIMQLLDKDPELRTQTAGDLRSACRRLDRAHIAKSVEKQHITDPAYEQGPGGRGTPPGLPAPARPRKRSRLLAVLAGLAVAAAGSFYWLARTPPAPRVTGITQITSDGIGKIHFVTDGTRLYYAAGSKDPDARFFQVSTKGGEPIFMPQLTGMCPLDISRDKSEMLLGRFTKGNSVGPYPIWVADTLGNALRRVGDLVADAAKWSPEGDEIAYTIKDELWVARSNGSHASRLAVGKSNLSNPVWSPDGRSIRFTTQERNASVLWQISREGGSMRPLLTEWAESLQASGAWSPNGEYFIFSAKKRDKILNLWAIHESRLFQSRTPTPIQLTTGPMIAYDPQTSPDGHRIYFLGGTNRGELVRYDVNSGQWTPYLGGIAAAQVDFSRDGKWITYINGPENTVWRSMLDGSQRLQLSEPSLNAVNPRWSPDGKLVTFYGSTAGKQDRIFVVSADGGVVRQVTDISSGDGNWSPDSASLVFGGLFPKKALGIVDLKTLKTSKLPNSDDLWSARLSRDGRYVAAMGPGVHNLWLYEMKTGARTELTKSGVGFPSWSPDGRYVYFRDGASTAWYRVGIPDKKLERLASLGGVRLTGSSMGWLGLSPEGFLIAARDTGSNDLYALDWETP